jgi:hypothetical protein
MKLKVFIDKLNKIESKNGNIDVVMADFISIKKVKVIKNIKDKNVLVISDEK